MNTQPVLETDGKKLVKEQVSVGMQRTSNKNIILQIRSDVFLAPYYLPEGALCSEGHPLRLYPKYVQHKGVNFKVNLRTNELNIPASFYSGHVNDIGVKSRLKIDVNIMPNGEIVLPPTVLQDRELRIINRTPKTNQMFPISGTTTGRVSSGLSPDALEKRYIGAVQFINEHRKEMRAKLTINASGFLLATVTKTVTFK